MNQGFFWRCSFRGDRRHRGGFIRWWAVGFLVAALLQAASVVAHDGGLTGPFLVGSVSDQSDCPWPIDPHTISPSSGYDGQFYLAMAFDPSLQRGTAECLDEPRYRARRILWPLIAHVTVLGWTPAIVPSLLLWNAVLTALGTGAAARWLMLDGHSPAWSLSYPLSLGVVTSLWRGLGDVALCSLLLLAFLGLRRDRPAWAALCLAGALLSKETALLAVLGIAAAATVHRKWSWVTACTFALVPLVAWWSYIDGMVSPPVIDFAAINLDRPLAGVLAAATEWCTSGRSPIRQGKDFAVAATYLSALAGGFLCLHAPLGRSSPVADAVRLSWAAFAVLGLCLSSAVWIELWAFARNLLPVLALGALWQWQRRPDRPLAPGALPLYIAACFGAALAVYWTLTGTD